MIPNKFQKIFQINESNKPINNEFNNCTHGDRPIYMKGNYSHERLFATLNGNYSELTCKQ